MRPTDEFRGVVVAYDAGRGFGFIRSSAFPEDVFVHATAIEGTGPLHPGQRVRFAAETAERGPRASRVLPGRRGLTPGTAAAIGAAVLAVATAFGLRAAGFGWTWAWLGGLNLLTFAAYALDKSRAVRGRGRRIPEAVLLGLAAAGGTPGAVLGVVTLRHKLRKVPFMAVLVAIAACQIALLLYLASNS